MPNHFFPENVTIFSDDNTPQYRSWNRLLLADADASIDPNSIVNSFSEDGTGTEITVAGGTATDLPADGATYFFQLRDAQGDLMDATNFFDAKFAIEIVTPPANATDLYVTIGLFDDTTATGGMSGGLVYDLAPGPSARACNSAANTDDGADAANVKAVVEVSVLGEALRNVVAASYDSSSSYVAAAFRGGAFFPGGGIFATSPPIYIGVSVGRKTNIAGDATVKFKAYYLEFSQSAPLP